MSTQRTPKQVRDQFHRLGISINAWAKANNLSPITVRRVLDGEAKCLRGNSHRAAVLLGLKEGGIPPDDLSLVHFNVEPAPSQVQR